MGATKHENPSRRMPNGISVLSHIKSSRRRKPAAMLFKNYQNLWITTFAGITVMASSDFFKLGGWGFKRKVGKKGLHGRAVIPSGF
jgi:hypothetical protein